MRPAIGSRQVLLRLQATAGNAAVVAMLAGETPAPPAVVDGRVIRRATRWIHRMKSSSAPKQQGNGAGSASATSKALAANASATTGANPAPKDPFAVSLDDVAKEVEERGGPRRGARTNGVTTRSQDDDADSLSEEAAKNASLVDGALWEHLVGAEQARDGGISGAHDLFAFNQEIKSRGWVTDHSAEALRKVVSEVVTIKYGPPNTPERYTKTVIRQLNQKRSTWAPRFGAAIKKALDSGKVQPNGYFTVAEDGWSLGGYVDLATGRVKTIYLH